MTHVTCRLTAKNRDRLRNPTLGNRVWATSTFFIIGVTQLAYPLTPEIGRSSRFLTFIMRRKIYFSSEMHCLTSLTRLISPKSFLLAHMRQGLSRNQQRLLFIGPLCLYNNLLREFKLNSQKSVSLSEEKNWADYCRSSASCSPKTQLYLDRADCSRARLVRSIFSVLLRNVTNACA